MNKIQKTYYILKDWYHHYFNTPTNNHTNPYLFHTTKEQGWFS